MARNIRRSFVTVMSMSACFASIVVCGSKDNNNEKLKLGPPIDDARPRPAPTSGTLPTPTPTPAIPQDPQPSIYAGNTHTCLLTHKGKVYCWGGNLQGEIGSGKRSSIGLNDGDLEKMVPVDLGTEFIAEKLFVGRNHNCALAITGAVKCWGANSKGQLGLGDVLDRGNKDLQMGANLPYVKLPSGRKVIHMSLGASYTCAVLDNFKIVCWGDDAYTSSPSQPAQPGVLGRGVPHVGDMMIGNAPGEMGDQLITVNLGADFDAVKVAASLATTCALSKSGMIKCWGGNQWGQLGRDAKIPEIAGGDNAFMGDKLPYVNLGTISGRPLRAVDIIGSEMHTCAIVETGDAKCWGEATYGLYGLGSHASGDSDDSMHYDFIGDGERLNGEGGPETEMGDALRSTDWGYGRKATQIALSWARMCGIVADGNAVRCYGLNRYDSSVTGGALGIGRNGVGSDRGTADFPGENQGCYPRNTGDNAFDVMLPEKARSLGLKVISVATSAWDHTCIVYSNKMFSCFGDNAYGAAGTGPSSYGLEDIGMRNLPMFKVPE